MSRLRSANTLSASYRRLGPSGSANASDVLCGRGSSGEQTVGSRLSTRKRVVLADASCTPEYSMLGLYQSRPRALFFSDAPLHSGARAGF